MEVAAGGAPTSEAVEVLRANAALLREQVTLARNEVFRNRIRAVRDGALSVFVVLLAIGAGAMLWKARSAEGLVVEAFRAPPSLAASGLDGTVVASRVLDRLSAMQAATDSSRAPATFNDNWDEGLAVEVPQTGVSVGEVWSFLKRTLGHETRLTGEVVRTAQGGLAVTTRVGASPGVTVTGAAGDLDGLLDQSAEAVFRTAQPYRYWVWLNRQGGADAARPEAVLAGLEASPSKTERLWAHVGRAVDAIDAHDCEAGLAIAREALRLDPSFQKARWNVLDALECLGRDEERLAEARALAEILDRRDPRVTLNSQGLVRHNARASAAEFTGDFQTALAERRAMQGLAEYSGNAAVAQYEEAEALLALHEPSAAARRRKAADASGRAMPAGSALVGFLLADSAADPGPFRQAGAKALARDAGTWKVAPAFARAGDVSGARALLLEDAPPACHPCALANGEIAVAAGRGGEADRWFAEAMRLGPSLPQAPQLWGEAKLARGDLAGAAVLFRKAQALGPRWADPLKGEGDVLLRQGKARAAADRYARAARFAPRWGALHLAWGEALARQGKADAAREARRKAATMDLSGADRARLAAGNP